MVFIFREIKYELRCIIIDSVRNIELASRIANYVSINRNESVSLKNADWFSKN